MKKGNKGNIILVILFLGAVIGMVLSFGAGVGRRYQQVEVEYEPFESADDYAMLEIAQLDSYLCTMTKTANRKSGSVRYTAIVDQVKLYQATTVDGDTVYIVADSGDSTAFEKAVRVNTNDGNPTTLYGQRKVIYLDDYDFGDYNTLDQTWENTGEWANSIDVAVRVAVFEELAAGDGFLYLSDTPDTVTELAGYLPGTNAFFVFLALSVALGAFLAYSRHQKKETELRERVEAVKAADRRKRKEPPNGAS